MPDIKINRPVTSIPSNQPATSTQDHKYTLAKQGHTPAMKEVYLVGQYLLESQSKGQTPSVSDLKERINIERTKTKWFNKVVTKILHFVKGSTKAVTNEELIEKINYFVLKTEPLDKSDLADAARQMLANSGKPQEISNFALSFIKTIETSPKENSLQGKITAPPPAKGKTLPLR